MHSPVGYKLVLRYAISLGLLAYLFYLLDIKQIENVITDTRPVFLVMVIMVFFIERTLGAYRWHLLLTCIHISIPWRIVFKATFISGFFGNFLPGIVGTEIARIITITRSTNSLALAVSTVIFDRALGALALVSIALAAIAFAPRHVPDSVSITSTVILGVLIMGMGAVTNSKIRPFILRLIKRVTPGILQSRVEKLFMMVELIATRRRVLAISVLLAIIFQMLRIIAVIVGAYALNYNIALIYFLLYVPIILVLMLLPISLGGLGVREAGFVYFFGAELMPPEAAFTLSLIIYLGSVTAQLPGMIFWLQGVEKHSFRGT